MRTWSRNLGLQNLSEGRHFKKSMDQEYGPNQPMITTTYLTKLGMEGQQAKKLENKAALRITRSSGPINRRDGSQPARLTGPVQLGLTHGNAGITHIGFIDFVQ